MLSVIIITKNEEGRIKACLESVKWADEILVVDHGVTDGTLEIAKEYTKKIIRIQKDDLAFIRNEAAKKIEGEWVLYIDPDERVEALLREEIVELMKNPTHNAYAISRRNIVFGKEQRYGAFWPDWVIRLVRKEDFRGWVGKVHEYMNFKGELGYTKNSFIHLTHRNTDQIILKTLDWSRIDAQLRVDANHPKMSSWRFMRILLGELFYQGVKRGGFFSGTIGTIDAILQAFSLFITYVKLWEIQQPVPLDKKYDNIDAELLKNGFRYE